MQDVSDHGEDPRQRTRNLRTGLILAVVALTFFVGFIARRFFQ